MKSEERHRLHESELVHYGRIARGWLEKYGMKAALVLGAVLLVVAVVIFWSRGSAAEASRRWAPLVTANEEGDYQDAATELEGSEVGNWALLRHSQLALQNAGTLANSNRDSCALSLKTAHDGFEQLNRATPGNALKEHALFGLAQTREMLVGVAVGDVDPVSVEDAIKVYKQFVESFPNSPMKPLAEERIKSLQDSSSADFYAWYRGQNPSPNDRPRPRDVGTGGSLSGLPSPWDLDPPSAPSPARAEKANDVDPETTPADNKGAEGVTPDMGPETLPMTDGDGVETTTPDNKKPDGSSSNAEQSNSSDPAEETP